jgi:hypothetical protein
VLTPDAALSVLALAATVDGVYSYQTAIRLASGQVLRRSQGTLLPSSVNPRYHICGTNV